MELPLPKEPFNQNSYDKEEIENWVYDIVFKCI